MEVSLAAPAVATPRVFSAVEVYFAALRCLLPVREQPPNSNHGQMVEAFLRACGNAPGDPWCMAVLSFVGRACFGGEWPLRLTAGTYACADEAKSLGIRFLISEAEPGDIVLLWSEKDKRFHHAFVLEQRQASGRWDTFEGNTSEAGSREGTAFMHRTGDRGRVLRSGDRLVKWHRRIT